MCCCKNTFLFQKRFAFSLHNYQHKAMRILVNYKILNLKSVLLILIAFIFNLHNNAIAQQINISGKITDAVSGESLPGVSVITSSNNVGAISGENGNYKLELNPGTHTIIFKSIGYAEAQRTITLNEGQSLVLDQKMTPTQQEMQTIVVSAGKHEQKLEEVVVSMEVLKASYIESTNQTTLETAVEQISGVTVIDGQANIRGGSGFSYGAGSRVLVLVDDLPLLAGDANDAKWSFLPVENIEQVEVIKGASSALFGSSALNGVINLRTAYPTDKPQTSVTLFSGFFDTPQREETKWWGTKTQMTNGVNFSHRRKFKQLDIVFGGQYFNDEGYRLGETEERYRGNLNLRYNFKKIKGFSVGCALNAQQTKGGLFLLWDNDTTGALIPLATAAGNTLSNYTTTRVSVDPSITYVGKNVSHKIRTRYFLTNNVNDTEQEAKSEIYYGEYLFQAKIKKYFTWSTGVNYSESKVNGDLYNKQDGSNYAAYTQIDVDYKKLNVSAGFRVEQGEISGKKFDAQNLFRAGANYNVFKGTFVRASYGQGFRFPSIAEKFIRTRVGDIVIYPNDSLMPERGTSIEFGVRQNFKINKFLGFVDACYFITEYTDMMEFTFGSYGKPFVDPLFGLGFKSRNIGNVKITGYEISTGGSFSFGNWKDAFMGGITLIDPIQTDYNAARDTQLNSANTNVLKYRYRTLFKFDNEISYKKYALGFSCRYYSFMENIDRAFNDGIVGVKKYREANNKGEWVFDSRFSFEVNAYVKIAAVVKNLFNNEYMTRPADIQPPRSFNIQASVKF
jgi:iron complex outermembrane receptor protein